MSTTLWIILAAAAATYLTRVAGTWFCRDSNVSIRVWRPVSKRYQQRC